VFFRRQQKQLQHSDPESHLPSPESRRREIHKRIRDLKREIQHSQLWMALFFLISLGAAVDFRFLPPISEEIRELLGVAPSPTLISIALIIYAFSALILILGRMNTGTFRFRGWSHIAYLAAFYLFYYYTGELRDNFWPVFIAGLTILGLESYRVWSFCSEAIRNEEKILKFLEK